LAIAVAQLPPPMTANFGGFIMVGFLAPMAVVSFCFFFKKQKIKQYSGISS
jgi:hypothetical protein